MKKLFYLSILLLLNINLFSQDVPKQISYQGILKDASGNPVTENFLMTFSIYDVAAGGTPIWTESKVVAVRDGIFDTQLGSDSPLNITFDQQRFLGITIGSGSEMSPRTLLSPAPYSFMTLSVGDTSIGTNNLKSGAVTSAKIANGTIAAVDLADNSVTSAKISDEPGYNYNNTGNANLLYDLTDAGQAFTSVVLNAPSDGFAIVTGIAQVFITHTNGTMDNILLKVSKTSGDVTTPSFGVAVVRLPTSLPSGSAFVQCVSLTRVLPVTAGANTFYLNGKKSFGASSSLLAPEISAVFIPSRYGTGADAEEIFQGTTQNNFTGE